jgi:hydrogenase-1 operon protein HyaF
MPTTPIAPFTGPGSQPADEDGGTLAYMEMPSGMRTFSAPDLPEPEEAVGVEAALAALRRVLSALEAFGASGQGAVIDVLGLDTANRAFLDQILGEGEVSAIGGSDVQAQESVLAGVWRVRTVDEQGRIIGDCVEVAAFPVAVAARAFATAAPSIAIPASFGPGVFNAPPLLPEINDRIPAAAPDAAPHVINLSLLPHTEQDLICLDTLMGKGWLTVLSRGYGNCRVMSTGTRCVWWVRFYNSQETLILNAIEVTAIPEVICAAPEDIADSADRLREILEIYR